MLALPSHGVRHGTEQLIAGGRNWAIMTYVVHLELLTSWGGNLILVFPSMIYLFVSIPSSTYAIIHC